MEQPVSHMAKPISPVASPIGDVEPDRDMVHALHDLSHQLQEFRLNLMGRGLTHVLAIVIGASNCVNGHGRARPTYGTCFNCGERGHYALECLHIVRERGGMYSIFGQAKGREECVNPLQDARVAPPTMHVVMREGDGHVVGISVDSTDSFNVDIMANKRSQGAEQVNPDYEVQEDEDAIDNEEERVFQFSSYLSF